MVFMLCAIFCSLATIHEWKSVHLKLVHRRHCWHRRSHHRWLEWMGIGRNGASSVYRINWWIMSNELSHSNWCPLKLESKACRVDAMVFFFVFFLGCDGRVVKGSPFLISFLRSHSFVHRLVVLCWIVFLNYRAQRRLNIYLPRPFRSHQPARSLAQRSSESICVESPIQHFRLHMNSWFRFAFAFGAMSTNREIVLRNFNYYFIWSVARLQLDNQRINRCQMFCACFSLESPERPNEKKNNRYGNSLEQLEFGFSSIWQFAFVLCKLVCGGRQINSI